MTRSAQGAAEHAGFCAMAVFMALGKAQTSLNHLDRAVALDRGLIFGYYVATRPVLTQELRRDASIVWSGLKKAGGLLSRRGFPP